MTSSKPEFTLRAVVVGVLVALLVGASYPYVVLKMGFGPTISVVSAFFGYLGLTAVSFLTSLWAGKRVASNRYEYNLVQTAGTAAGQSGFMCVLLAAFDMLASKPELGFSIHPSPFQIFLWLSVAGCLGVLLAVPLRQHYIDEENLTFADGTAAGETLLILDADPKSAKTRIRMLAAGGIIGAVTTWFRDGIPRWIPEHTLFGNYLGKLNVGWHWSALSLGSGFIVGLRTCLSMLLGAGLAWVWLPSVLHAHGIAAPEFKPMLKWVMWPATGLMVAAGLTALLLKWKLLLKTFTELHLAREGKSDFPIRSVAVGALLLSVALVVIQKWSMNISIFHSIVALLVSIPLMLVGTRVLGETNWAPISSMANMVQALFAAIAPGNVAVNMIASGMSGTVAANGEHLMQDYKAGKIVGSNNQYLTWMQLLATPVGAFTVAWVYPILRSTYGIGVEKYGVDPQLAHNDVPGLTSPVSVKWAGFAELLSQGFQSLPPYCLHALAFAGGVGVVLTALEPKYKRFVPSPTGIGLGMLIPTYYILPMAAGAILQYMWHKKRPQAEEALSTPLASGLIVGEALLALIIPILLYMGWISAANTIGGH